MAWLIETFHTKEAYGADLDFLTDKASPCRVGAGQRGVRGLAPTASVGPLECFYFYLFIFVFSSPILPFSSYGLQVWPFARLSHLSHDAYSCARFPDTRSFPSPRPRNYQHVGQVSETRLKKPALSLNLLL